MSGQEELDEGDMRGGLIALAEREPSLIDDAWTSDGFVGRSSATEPGAAEGTPRRWAILESGDIRLADFVAERDPALGHRARSGRTDRSEDEMCRTIELFPAGLRDRHTAAPTRPAALSSSRRYWSMAQGIAIALAAAVVTAVLFAGLGWLMSQ